MRTLTPRDDLRFSNTTGILQKKNVVYPGAEVEQQTSAPPPKKNPGSAPAITYLRRTTDTSDTVNGRLISGLCSKIPQNLNLKFLHDSK